VPRLAVIALASLAIAAPTRAQAVLTDITADALAATIREASSGFGVPVQATPRVAPDTSFVVVGEIMFPADSASGPDTLRFFVGLDGCDGEACGALSAVAFFGTDEGGPGPADMNLWNATRRLTRAYVTPEGLALQSDYDLVGGVTRESVARFIRSFLISLVTFADVLQSTGAPPDAGTPPPD
jgi:hypothetical protein